MTPSAARKNGRRTAAGTLGRCGVRRGRERSSTGSGIAKTPAKAMTNRMASVT
jgi:hypothetical protein